MHRRGKEGRKSECTPLHLRVAWSVSYSLAPVTSGRAQARGEGSHAFSQPWRKKESESHARDLQETVQRAKE